MNRQAEWAGRFVRGRCESRKGVASTWALLAIVLACGLPAGNVLGQVFCQCYESDCDEDFGFPDSAVPVARISLFDFLDCPPGGIQAWERNQVASGFMIANGVFLTTHIPCMLSHLDELVVEFNVPDSDDCYLVAAAEEDRFTVSRIIAEESCDSTTYESGYPDCWGWVALELNPNSVTGNLPAGFVRVASWNGSGSNLVVPGYQCVPLVSGGSHDNGTMFERDGDWESEIESHGMKLWEHYVSLQNWAEGAPVILPSHDVAVGIQDRVEYFDESFPSSGDCEHLAVTFANSSLVNAIDDYLGVDTHYVDGHSYPESSTGSIVSPWGTVAEGAAAVPIGAKLAIVGGTYGESLTIDRPMTIVAISGVVTIN